MEQQEELTTPTKSFEDRMNSVVENTVIFFRGIYRMQQEIEIVFIDLVSAVAPWFAPLPSAITLYTNATKYLDYDHTGAMIIAFVAESIGLVTIATLFMLWGHNKSHEQDQKEQRDLWPVATASILYLLIILVVNAILGEKSIQEHIALALISSLTIIAAINLAARADHHRRNKKMNEIESEMQEVEAQNRADRREAKREQQALKYQMELERIRIQAGAQQSTPQQYQSAPISSRFDWRTLSPEIKQKYSGWSAEDILADNPGMAESTSRAWANYAAKK